MPKTITVDPLSRSSIQDAIKELKKYKKWIAEKAAPEKAAADGSIDDVIASCELRQRICSAVYMLMMKNSGSFARKHCNLPL